MRKPDWQTADESIRLYLGDCLDVLPGLEAGSVDAVVTDPPYGIVNQFGENVGNGTRKMQFEWDGPHVTEQVVNALRLSLSKCRKSAACFVFCGGDQFGRILEVPRELCFTVKPAAWVKDCPPPPGKGNWWPSAFELAVYGYRQSPYFGDTDPKRSNVFRADSYRFGQPGKVDHPTQKPLKLVLRLVLAIVPPRLYPHRPPLHWHRKRTQVLRDSRQAHRGRVTAAHAL
jgi:site-specific DNA-methyltransferase (adenine-specific)